MGSRWPCRRRRLWSSCLFVRAYAWYHGRRCCQHRLSGMVDSRRPHTSSSYSGKVKRRNFVACIVSLSPSRTVGRNVRLQLMCGGGLFSPNLSGRVGRSSHWETIGAYENTSGIVIEIFKKSLFLSFSLHFAFSVNYLSFLNFRINLLCFPVGVKTRKKMAFTVQV
jgi:hypothetical protein